jgi:glycosyltransferase involved in cell wall biosynthesis
MHKKKILFIAPYPFDEAPSQRFRFEQYFAFLKENNFEIVFSPFLDHKTWRTLYSEGKVLRKMIGVVKSFLKRLTLLFTLYKYDYVFIHREASHVGPPVFEFLISKVFRKKYNYDFDDAIWLPNYSETNARFHRLKAYWKVRYCIKWAGSITAGNDYLANYARKFNSNVQVIPTTIDTENHHNLKTDYQQDKLIIGWTGTHTTMHYLDYIIPVIKELEQKYDFEFLVISNEAPAYPLKSLRFLKWKRETEIADLARISIGVMPLEMDIWSEGKCGFKGLQYMALGIPALMSPVGVNTQIISHTENGFLVIKLEDWKNQLEVLLTDIDLRKRIGAAGKKTIDERYSVNSNQSKYLSLFQ